jgi:hypothetical protein
MWRRLIDRLHDERGIKKLKLARRVIEFIDRADDALLMSEESGYPADAADRVPV